MQGSLDHPPVVVRAARSWALAYLAGCLLFVAVGFYSLRFSWAAWLGIPVFALTALVFLVQVLFPATLRLAPEGVAWFTGFKTYRYRWDEIENFRVSRLPASPLTEMVGFEYSPAARERRRIDPNKPQGSIDGAFGTNWEISSAELVALLEKSRRHWLR